MVENTLLGDALMISHILSIVLLGSSWTHAAVEGGDTLRASTMSAIFTRCAGLYDAAAMIQQSAGKSADTQVMTGYADGAEKTATALLMVSGVSEDQAEIMAGEQRRSQAMYHIAFLQAGNGGALVSTFTRCTKDYMPIQQSVLAAWRA